MYNHDFSEPFRLGMKAFHEGKKEAGNQYDPGSRNDKEWHSGYEYAANYLDVVPANVDRRF
jgi:hypothetical protein